MWHLEFLSWSNYQNYKMWTLAKEFHRKRGGRGYLTIFLIKIFFSWHYVYVYVGLPSGTSGKEPDCQWRRCNRHGSIPGSGRSPKGGHGNSLQYSCLEKPKDRGAWRAMAHKVANSQTQLKWLSTGACMRVCVCVCVCARACLRILSHI